MKRPRPGSFAATTRRPRPGRAEPPGAALGTDPGRGPLIAEGLPAISHRRCPFIKLHRRTARPLPSRTQVIEEYKALQTRRLVGLCAEAGLPDPEQAAAEITFVLEGAQVSTQNGSIDQAGTIDENRRGDRGSALLPPRRMIVSLFVGVADQLVVLFVVLGSAGVLSGTRGTAHRGPRRMPHSSRPGGAGSGEVDVEHLDVLQARAGRLSTARRTAGRALRMSGDSGAAGAGAYAVVMTVLVKTASLTRYAQRCDDGSDPRLSFLAAGVVDLGPLRGVDAHRGPALRVVRVPAGVAGPWRSRTQAWCMRVARSVGGLSGPSRAPAPCNWGSWARSKTKGSFDRVGGAECSVQGGGAPGELVAEGGRTRVGGMGAGQAQLPAPNSASPMMADRNAPKEASGRVLRYVSTSCAGFGCERAAASSTSPAVEVEYLSTGTR